MRLGISKSKNSTSLYVIKSTYENGVHSSKIVEKLGTITNLSKEHEDPIEWAKNYISELNKMEKEQKRDVIIKYNQSTMIIKDEQRSFNAGYLFLQQLYHQLGLHRISKEISNNYKFTFDLDSILSRLIYGRILFPSSKLNTYREAKSLLEQPNFELHQVYRALEVIAKGTDFIQSELYKNSLSISKRNDRILEKRLGEAFTSHEIIGGLWDMNFYAVMGEGFIPTYTRTDLTDAFDYKTIMLQLQYNPYNLRTYFISYRRIISINLARKVALSK